MSDNAVIYARFSPRPNAAESESLQVQSSRCRSYCAHQGLQVVASFDDPEVSARKVPLADRPSGGKMLEYVKKNKIKHIVAMRLDRLFRSSIDGMLTVAKLREDNVSVHFADQGGNSICTGTSIGQLIFSMMLCISEFEPRQTAERTSTSMRHKQSQGKRMSRLPPYGWYIDARDTTVLVQHPVEQSVIARIMKMHEMGFSDFSISRLLNREGIYFRSKPFSSQKIGKLIHREHARRGSVSATKKQTPVGLIPKEAEGLETRTATDGDVVPEMDATQDESGESDESGDADGQE